jgi:hypothetical protein
MDRTGVKFMVNPFRAGRCTGSLTYFSPYAANEARWGRHTVAHGETAVGQKASRGTKQEAIFSPNAVALGHNISPLNGAERAGLTTR